MDPPKYVPPHLRQGAATNAATNAAVYHSEQWNPARESLLAWVKLGKWRTGGQFVPKLKGNKEKKGRKAKNPYYTVFYENAIKRPTDGKLFHVCMNIHVYGEAGAVWISGVDESFFELRNEPDTPCDDIEQLWAQTAKDTYLKKT